MAMVPCIRVMMDLTKVSASAHKLTWLLVNPDFATIDDFRTHVFRIFDLTSNVQLYVGGGHLPQSEPITLLQQNDVVQIRYCMPALIEDNANIVANNVNNSIECQPEIERENDNPLCDIPTLPIKKKKKRRNTEFSNGEIQPHVESADEGSVQFDSPCSPRKRKKKKEIKLESFGLDCTESPVVDVCSYDTSMSTRATETVAVTKELVEDTTETIEAFANESTLSINSKKRKRRRHRKRKSRQNPDASVTADESNLDAKEDEIEVVYPLNEVVDLSNEDEANPQWLLPLYNQLIEHQIKRIHEATGAQLTSCSTPVKQTKDYNQCKAINVLPPVGTRLAFKVIELSEQYCPEVSDYKEGVIVKIGEGDVVTIELFAKEIKPAREGKFENIYHNDEPQEEVVQKIITEWVKILEPKLLAPA